MTEELIVFRSAEVSILAIDSIAPDFELRDDAGADFRLTRALADGPAVLFFYPKDETAGCTREVCQFRDEFEKFSATGAQVLGISVDSVQSHAAFREHHRLPYRLLSDPGRKVAGLYGLAKALGFLPPRVTFVVDEKQRIRLAFSSMLAFHAHVEKALACVKLLSAS